MRSGIKITVIVTLLSILSIKAQTIGHATVKTWANDRKSAFSFTFDDCLKSQYDYAVPVLNSFGFKATFFVIAEEPTDPGQPLNWRYGTWDEFRQIAAEGHEIGSHSMTHPHLPQLPLGDISTPNTVYYELYQSKELIEQKIPGINVTTFAYPYTEYNNNVQTIAGSYYESSRAGGDLPNSAVITGNTWNKLNAYEVQFNTPRNSVSDDNDELTQIENTLQDDVLSSGKWGILFAHEILPFSQIPDAVAAGYWYPMSTEWLTSFCQWMKTKSDNNEVWVTTQGNVTKYIKERENFSSSIISATNSKIEISVTDTLDNNIFNYPLTVDILVPSTWQNVVVKQGSDSSTISTFSTGGNTYVRANVIPDGGTVVLTDDNATDIADIENNTPNQFVLNQNYPNPFNPSTTISYAIPSESKVKLQIINLLGQEVATLVNGTESAGHHKVKFNAGNLASGIYIYRIMAVSLNSKKEFVSTKKLMLLK